LGALTHIHEVRVQQFDGTRKRDFHPLPERRLDHSSLGEVEIGTSDGSRHVFRAGDIRLMEDVTGRGHTTLTEARHPPSTSSSRTRTADSLVPVAQAALSMRLLTRGCCPGGYAPGVAIL